MKFFQRLQEKREQMKPETVHLDGVGVDVQVMRPLLSHRSQLIANDKASDKKIYAFLVIAICLWENSQRQIDVLDYEEIKDSLDMLEEGDFLKLFEKCQELTKATQQDVEDAQKN